MRLGGRNISVQRKTLAHSLYRKEMIRERFRHRYEVNPRYEDALSKQGLILSGRTENFTALVEIKNHPFFLGTQFHPEFTSSLERPNPCYLGFIDACLKN